MVFRRKIRSGLGLFFLLWAQAAAAQTFEEWFHQRETQVRYLKEQIAALGVYLDYAEKGYRIARDGIDWISALRKGEWQLFEEYFGSLKKTNPFITGAGTAQLTERIRQAAQKEQAAAVDFLHGSSAFTAEEKRYCRGVIGAIFGTIEATYQEYRDFTRDENFRLSDAERYDRVIEISKSMGDHFSLLHSFCQSVYGLAAARVGAAAELGRERRW